ncbi:LacI family DNA-binding transcriptional regulator [uncultured Microbacterium sp.]|uniref:LacI family DNA-binding transcriptional regulator n=1 Tax=uncultured Microbacterium sp. TaxID=191216 RepID=UPI002636E2ED|nr:LacI family DNA-binding transcriptional regulator [uncultured Microbacterium sp.]
MLERASSMRDVARMAGVSLQTVSRVANGEPHVADAKRERVLAAMRDLEYRPNSAARAMRRGAYRSVGVVYHSLHSVGTHRSLEEISERAAGHGYGTTIMPVAAASGRAASSAFTRLGEMAVDAVIVVFPSPFGLDATLEIPTAVPLVVLGPPQGGGSSSVGFDQDGGAVQAIGHLLALGHPTIHHIAGPADSFSGAARTAAWRRLLEADGRRITAYGHGDWSAESGYTLTRRMLETERPSAIFVGNDQMALGTYRALAEAGLRVPQDVSVVGFDDVDEAPMYAPPLTTVAQDWDGLGRESLRIALSMTRGGAPEDVNLPLRLIVRDSTGPYRPA